MAHGDDDGKIVNPARTHIIRAGSSHTEPLRLGRGRSERLTGRRSGVGALVVDRVTIDPGTPRGPFHLHRHTSNTFVVLDGELEVRASGHAHRLRSGDAIFLSAGQPHGTHNLSDRPTSVLAIYERSPDDDFELAPEDRVRPIANQ